jgi:hypothetical protein
MEHISELRRSLNEHFRWNKARMTCFVQMMLALITVRTVNLSRLACIISGGAAEQASRYRRLQRFFSGFKIDFDKVAEFMFLLFFSTSDSWHLTLDRTNWKWGKANINILTLGIVYKGTAIPIYWELLDKRGNSDYAERISLIKKFVDKFGKEKISDLLCDREFIGKEWFAWLQEEKISFCIRVRNNTITRNSRGDRVTMGMLFFDLKPRETRVLHGRRKVMHAMVYLTGMRLSDGEMLIVASDKSPENAVERYGSRWEIETLFGCLKGRGFNFEDTHITQGERLKKLMVLLSIAFAWAHKTGEWRSRTRPIKVKKHGRPAISLFRAGLDFITEAISSILIRPLRLDNCLKILKNTEYWTVNGVLA